MTARTVAVVPAQMGSSRPPGKVMLPLFGEPALTLVLRRLGRARTLDEVVVATTPLPEDDPIVELAERAGHRVVRGGERMCSTDTWQQRGRPTRGWIMRITWDCPLIDPRSSTSSSTNFARAAWTSRATCSCRGPCRSGSLSSSCAGQRSSSQRREDSDPAWRERVTPYLYRRPELFRLLRVAADSD